MNYFVVDVRSNIIVDVIASTKTPNSIEATLFVPATENRLNLYYELKERGDPVDLHSILPRPKPPKIPEIFPLPKEALASLREYVSKVRHQETIEQMAWVWRVSERTVREVIEDL